MQSLGFDEGPVTGGMLVSEPITLALPQRLSTTVSFLSNEGNNPPYDVAGIYLLHENSATHVTEWHPAGGHYLGNTVTLGDVTYGPTRFDDICVLQPPSACERTGGSTPWYTYSVQPGEGTYRLVYTAFNTQDSAVETGLAVKSLAVKSVPEVSSLPVPALDFAIVTLAFITVYRRWGMNPLLRR